MILDWFIYIYSYLFQFIKVSLRVRLLLSIKLSQMITKTEIQLIIPLYASTENGIKKSERKLFLGPIHLAEIKRLLPKWLQ